MSFEGFEVIYLFSYLCCILHYSTRKSLYNMFTLKLHCADLNCADLEHAEVERAEVERADKCTTQNL